ncbi:spore maturation protein CgeB [Bacillus oleivorans]|uniref:Spore maturation protein CgeB n=1 Tax=Bacillus oleivorans TaxID=1448271 RepID=A0A285D4Z2_9BACI|nr:glycosyltransferase [Bacillus oleivorans]SNX74881.1 spore maturation protein CgeB [Bacillus oleivorans]
MNILLISSSGKGIYPHIEKSIEDAFLAFNHTISKIEPVYSPDTIETINRLNPELVLSIVGHKMDPKLIKFIKKREMNLCIWLTEDPFYMDYSMKIIEDYDFIFTVDLGAFEFYKKMFPNKHIFHLPLGTDPSIYYPEPADKLFDLCLVGYPYPERIDLVNHILKTTSYSIILAGPLWKGVIRNINNLKKMNIIGKWIEPSTVREIFNRSKIILNPHRSSQFAKNKNTLNIESKSINNRTFDIAACGGFQLISDKPDIEQHFDHPCEMVSFSNEDNCIDLIHHFISDEKKRNDYSHHAHRRVLNNHTFLHRIQFMINQINFYK